MSQRSSIEWTDATWNPVTGCTKVSPGCDHCYAERFAERFRGVAKHPYEPGFSLTLRPKRLEDPLHWRNPRLIFVNSMSDLFHKDIPVDFVDAIFSTMEQASWHIFQILTKRSSLMRYYVNNRYSNCRAPSNIWMGVSVEDADRKSRITHLQQTKAQVRFISFEPLIGEVGDVDLVDVHWAIAGGESGPGYRPLRLEWIREIRDQCMKQSVPFFFKQWGGPTPKSGGRRLDGQEWSEYPAGYAMHRKATGGDSTRLEWSTHAAIRHNSMAN